MISQAVIRKFGRRIGTEFHAERVILFGSYARGEASEDSDVDLFVILPGSGRGFDEAVRIHVELRPPFAIDVLVRTPEVVRRRLKMGDPFIRSIFEEGKILYESRGR